MPKRTKSSARWLAEHANDEYVKRAQRDGWRSRAVYKLEEIQQRERLLRPGIRCVDLGAAPGSWSQYAARLLGGQGRLVATDILRWMQSTGCNLSRAISGNLLCWMRSFCV